MLPRALSKLGYCSRTQAERLIADGRVSVDGRIVTDLTHWVDVNASRIAVDGIAVVAEERVYLMLNKPRGLVTTRDDPEGRETVFSCLKEFDTPHLSPVGRLDKASEGLLLFTNDTVLAQKLLDPETHVPKLYHVQTGGKLDDAALEKMRAGIVDDGEFLTASAIRRLREGDRNAWLEIELREGKNRQIRRMLEHAGAECLRLIRVAIGDIVLGGLPKGKARMLTAAEVEGLRRQVQS